MKILAMILALIQSLLLKIFPFLGYQGVITTQINIYKKIKRRYPGMLENDVLNHVIVSRIESWPRAASKEEEYAHYQPLLEDNNKTLEDVIWAIIDWENIESRRQYIYNRLSRMGLSTLEMVTHMNAFDLKVKEDIEKGIRKKIKKS